MQKKTLISLALVAFVSLVLVIVAILAGSDDNRIDEMTPTRSEASAEEARRGAAASSLSSSAATEADEPAPSDSNVSEPESVSDPAGADVARPRILRVILEGIDEVEAHDATLVLTGVDHRREWPSHLKRTLSVRGLTNEYDLAPYFRRIAGLRNWDLRLDGLAIKVMHPRHRIERRSIALSDAIAEDERDVYELRIPLEPGVPHVFWPELTLAVRDARTRAHLDDVELRMVPTAFMGLNQVPGSSDVFTPLSEGLSSPIVLRGGRESSAPATDFAGLALDRGPAAAPRLIELVQPEATDRGVMIYARAPGYAWGRIVLDVSAGAERELLLDPGSTLDLTLSNVRLADYRALPAEVELRIGRRLANGETERAWQQTLDDLLAREGLRLDSLGPGDYTATVELSDGVWTGDPVLGREDFRLVPGEDLRLEITLADPPAPPERVTLAGTLSFPDFPGADTARLRLYRQNYEHGAADHELSVGEMERIGGVRPTWAFRFESLPVGTYQVRIAPLLRDWIVTVPPGGREDLNLEIEALTELSVEVVDARSGDRIEVPELALRRREELAGRITAQGTATAPESPGFFRFWTVPGQITLWPLRLSSRFGYAPRRLNLDLSPGRQSARLELAASHRIHIVFRDGQAVLPRGDNIYVGLARQIRAVDHEGAVTGNLLFLEKIVEVSAPGTYEIGFEGIGADRFRPLSPRRIEVRSDPTTEVVVDLTRK